LRPGSEEREGLSLGTVKVRKKNIYIYIWFIVMIWFIVYLVQFIVIIMIYCKYYYCNICHDSVITTFILIVLYYYMCIFYGLISHSILSNRYAWCQICN
jgi:hypothetical protein